MAGFSGTGKRDRARPRPRGIMNDETRLCTLFVLCSQYVLFAGGGAGRFRSEWLVL